MKRVDQSAPAYAVFTQSNSTLLDTVVLAKSGALQIRAQFTQINLSTARRRKMKKMRALSGALALSLMAMSAVPAAAQRYDRAEHHEPKKKSDKTGNTLLGVGLGLLGGAILSGGDPWASLAGAAAGGAIGNIASGDNRNKRQDDWRYRRDRDPRRDDRRYYHDRRYRDDRR